jgi:hypothetical protein
MTVQSSESSHPLLSCTDGVAASTTDILLLVGRVLIGWLFLSSSWGKLANIAGFEGYLTALKAPAPGIMAWIGASVEFLIGITLILGIGTRYAALLCALFSSSARPPWRTATGNTRPLRWPRNKRTSSKIWRSWAARYSCS